MNLDKCMRQLNTVKLRIQDARWTPRVNMLDIACEICGGRFEHRADRWNVKCPTCGESDNLRRIRWAYVALNHLTKRT